jgi:hypothetical protein
MKKINLLILMLLVFSVFSISVLAQGSEAQQNQQQALINENIEGGEVSDLTEVEINGLLLMREEEKLARDIYLELYDKWNLQTFNNIASSEQTHTNAVKVLLEEYGVEDPVVSDERGTFTNKELASLYVTLIEKGQESLLEALIVGATVEDLDIKDLNELLEETTNEDIILVYENLRKGSRNHMRAFNRQIENNGGTYEAQYLSQDNIDSIVLGEQERGPILDEDSNVVSGFESQLQTRKGTGMGATGTRLGSGEGTGARIGLQDGTYTDSKGKKFGIMQQNNRRMMESNGVSANCLLCDEMNKEGNRFNAKLSNGRNAEIKIMPDTASERALKRLKLKNCDENCNIELKEVGSGEQVRAAYEVKAQRNSRVFGIFSAKMDVEAQIDAETGELIRTNKPWWAFLASEKEE